MLPDVSRLSRAEKIALAAGGVLAAGIVTWGVVRARRGASPVYGEADCRGVGKTGGTLAGFRYLERATDGAAADVPLPMIVLFHSRGSSPENHAGMFYESMGIPVRVLLPEGPNVLGSHRSWTSRSSKTTDQAAWADELGELANKMGQFIHDAVECYPTVGKPLVTGSSEGGHMAYLMASSDPELVGGAVAVAGYLPQALWNSAMAETVGLHGEDDTAVPFARTEQYWQAMKALGAQISTQSFPGVGHSVPSSVSRAWRDALRAML